MRRPRRVEFSAKEFFSHDLLPKRQRVQRAARRVLLLEARQPLLRLDLQRRQRRGQPPRRRRAHGVGHGAAVGRAREAADGGAELGGVRQPVRAQLERPADWSTMAYGGVTKGNDLTAAEIQSIMLLRVDFSKEAVASVCAVLRKE